MDLGISLSDYAVNQDTLLGESSSAELSDLQKAMNAGDLTGRDLNGQVTTGASLKVESLENTLKLLTFKESDIVLWKKIPKLPAYNTVEEYNQQIDYGSQGNSFNNEGELPEEDDASYRRDSQKVKYMGTTRIITHPMTLVNTMIGNVIQAQVEAGTMKLLRDVNRGLAFADEKIIPQEFNGLYAQHRNSFSTLAAWNDSSVVIDLKGKALTESAVEDAALAIIENFGEATSLFAPPKVLSNFTKRFHGYKQILPNTPALTDGTMGQAVNSFMSQFGKLDLGYDKFLKSGPAKTTVSTPAAKAPAAPVADGSTPTALASDASFTKFSGANGDYWVAVSAVNKYGESALTVLGASKVTVGATQSIDLKFTAGVGAIPATGFRIYRSMVNPAAATAADATFYPLFDVSVNDLAIGYDGGAAGIIRDRNRIMPNTDKSFMIDFDTQVVSFKQLAPLMKMDLGQLGPAIRFMVLLYGTPILYAPKKMVQFTNIGSDLT